MELILYRKTDQKDVDPLIILLDKIMENPPYKTLVCKIGKAVEVEDSVGYAVLRTYPELFKQDKTRPKQNTKVMRKYEDKSLVANEEKSVDLRAIVDAEFP
jgi:hypothetical protein